ncbi:MAG: ATP-binding protein [Peptostreptococcaceae bacterium]
MTTPKRTWYEGARYHITSRGNRRNDIYKDEEDFQVYLTILEEALQYYEKYNYKLISYCLMDNHIHLIIQTDIQPVGHLISRIHSIYTKYFNKKYNYIGHLFQDRYHLEIIESDAQLLETSRYVHLNPVKARIVEKPNEYKWSSYSMIMEAKEKGIRNIVVPIDNIKEASLVSEMNVFAFNNLKDVTDFLNGVNPYEPIINKKENYKIDNPYIIDFQDVQGQDSAIEFVAVAAAGGHNLLMSGSPGCGKSMIAKRIPTILPSMTEEEALEVTKIYSVAGLLKNRGSLITDRPFRSPHHNASMNSLVGGGMFAMPGEISLAHNGVSCNAQMTPELINEYCNLDEESMRMLRQAYEKFQYSARTYHKFLRVARTFADMECEMNINKSHIIKALMCREIEKEQATMVVV